MFLKDVTMPCKKDINGKRIVYKKGSLVKVIFRDGSERIIEVPRSCCLSVLKQAFVFKFELDLSQIVSIIKIDKAGKEMKDERMGIH